VALPTFSIEIATGSSTPIYRQIVEHVCQATVTGVLRAGDQLPSVRELAEQLVLNPNTIARAYGELVREGIAEGRQGRGFFVAPRRQIYADGERRRRLSAAVNRLVNEALFLGVEPAELRDAVDRRFSELTRSSAQSDSQESQVRES
jgi:GntR family transcriptional regulator